MTGPDAAAPAWLGREALFALQVVDEAVRLARAVQGATPTAALTKPDASPATVADFAVQALVAARLTRDCFP